MKFHFAYDSFSSFIRLRPTHIKRIFEVSVSWKIFYFLVSVDDVVAAVANSTHNLFDSLAFSAKDPGNIVCVSMFFPFSVQLYHENILIKKFFSRRLKMLTSQAQAHETSNVLFGNGNSCRLLIIIK